MRINADNMNNTKVRGVEIEIVGQVTYLRRIISTSGYTTNEKESTTSFCNSQTNLEEQNTQNINKNQNLNSNVKSVFLHGSETWRSTVTSTKTIQVFINRCLQNIIEIKWPERTHGKGPKKNWSPLQYQQENGGGLATHSGWKTQT